ACVADGAEIAGRRHRLGHAAALENHPTLNPTTEHCGDLTTLTFIDGLKQGQMDAQSDKPAQGALYFVSFSIPETGLKRMLSEARRFGIPATLRGMVQNDMKTTADAIMALVKDGSTDGVAIDPTRYREFDITSVPSLVVFCPAGHDVIRGNLRLKQALEKVVEKGDCRDEARRLLEEGAKK
ncbi:type-F conjugative transfer system pilin assembly protein TrbC, partial [Serratia sp. T13T92]|uniref:type-F conjugative transfer system pilin assembly protein TrbC n=1 Tax=Serratia sp. T13T92 TaxID=3397496 RepID=UPI0039E00E59